MGKIVLNCHCSEIYNNNAIFTNVYSVWAKWDVWTKEREGEKDGDKEEDEARTTEKK